MQHRIDTKIKDGVVVCVVRNVHRRARFLKLDIFVGIAVVFEQNSAVYNAIPVNTGGRLACPSCILPRSPSSTAEIELCLLYYRRRNGTLAASLRKPGLLCSYSSASSFAHFYSIFLRLAISSFPYINR